MGLPTKLRHRIFSNALLSVHKYCLGAAVIIAETSMVFMARGPSSRCALSNRKWDSL